MEKKPKKEESNLCEADQKVMGRAAITILDNYLFFKNIWFKIYLSVIYTCSSKKYIIFSNFVSTKAVLM